MIEGVNGFGKILENTHRRIVLVDCRSYFIYQMNLRVRCRVIFLKYKLTAVKYIVFFGKFYWAIVYDFFEKFGKN